MSWQATARVADLVDDLTRGEKLVLFVLANRHNPETGRLDVGIDRVATEALMERRSAERILSALEAKGFITVTKRAGRTNQYALSCLASPPTPTSGVERGNPRRPRRGYAIGKNPTTPDMLEAEPPTPTSGVARQKNGLTPDAHVGTTPDAHVGTPPTPTSGKPKENRKIEPKETTSSARARARRRSAVELYEATFGDASPIVAEICAGLDLAHPAECVTWAFTHVAAFRSPSMLSVQRVLNECAIPNVGHGPRKARPYGRDTDTPSNGHRPTEPARLDTRPSASGDRRGSSRPGRGGARW